jgi:hypothetical protein
MSSGVGGFSAVPETLLIPLAARAMQPRADLISSMRSTASDFSSAA